jgi:allophanate hydrolase subunit 2
VVATVVSASMPIAAQLLPGDELRLAEVGFQRAHEMRMLLERALDSIRNA